MKKAVLTIRKYGCRFIYQPVFIIGITGSKAAIFSGKAKPNFVSACQEIISRNNITDGFIYGVKDQQASSPIIKGSLEFDKESLQQIRNIWGFS